MSRPKQSRVDWDRVITSAPMNKDAALARDGRCTSWTPARKFNNLRSDVPLPTKKWNGHPEHDLTWQRFGDLTVIGPASDKSSPTRWVVRCVCGCYEHRKASGLRKNAADGRLFCAECDYLKELRKGNVPQVKIGGVP